MATISASGIIQFNPFGDTVATGVYVRPWKNRIRGFCYSDSAPLQAQVVIFNPQMNEVLGSTVSATDGSWLVETIPQRYENSKLVAVLLPLSGSTAVPQIKTGIFPV